MFFSITETFKIPAMIIHCSLSRAEAEAEAAEEDEEEILNTLMLCSTMESGGNYLSNLRKRGRDVSVSAPIINPLCFQPQIIDLSQLHNHHHPSNVVSTGLRLSSGDQGLNPHHHTPPQNDDNLVSLSSSVFISDDFSSQIKGQRDEIDQFLQAQEEELRRALAEKRHRHYRELLGAVEATAVRRLREKEVEVEKATRRHAELEARAARLSMEAQAWQEKARAEEAAAATLQAQLQQAIIKGAGIGGGGDCTAEDAESGYVDPDRVIAESGPSCKACRKRVASVVLLPCRHFCICTVCDHVVRTCPLCRALRNSSVEVYLS
ncbi:BOI-related E3 ubiquitin-protein ligase 1-like isoform X2 [Cucurbita moschata]|uniref:BOI-related E3 ubiquitin-protein ligase 1-like isoform X2 n=1 Tax=Cucurbita moschata TaxID=3662 RepID=A0A6J1E713_CUCMO|nr:BOI-related E3 ubiquitin-protein ligase 1-like isoform X2 [Cucurbita moschata]